MKPAALLTPKLLRLAVIEKRKSLGLSQGEFAKAAGVSQPVMSRWEAGLVVPDVLEFSRLMALVPTGKPALKPKHVCPKCEFSW